MIYMGTRRILIGLSGGVDSSVSAALLLEQGYDVIGVHLQMVHNVPGLPTEGCTATEDRHDAIRTAAHLGIPIEIRDAAGAYEQHVLQPFIQAYTQGLTPNPDVWCNEFVKFPLMLALAKECGANAIATGHYARADQGRLFRGADPTKDQSYFLSRMTKEQLHSTFFPLGEWKKEDVRAKAASLQLPVASKKESMGLCFVGNIDVSAFLKERLPRSVGPIVDMHTQETIGEHDGLPFYTIGQRKGIELSGGPWYVVKKEMKHNILYVTNVASDPELFSRRVTVRAAVGEGWALDGLTVQTRYRQTPLDVESVEKTNDGYAVVTTSAQRAVTPGQELVLYQGQQVVGAGIVA